VDWSGEQENERKDLADIGLKGREEGRER